MADGSGSARLMAALHTRFPGLKMTSGYRPGAKTLSGKTSMHASGNAVDIPPQPEVFDWIRTNFKDVTFELIYSPKGPKQIYKGADHIYTGAVVGQHFNHIHWSVKPEDQGKLGAPAGGATPVGLPATPTAGGLPGVEQLSQLAAFFEERHGFRRLVFVGLGLAVALAGVGMIVGEAKGPVAGAVKGMI